MPFPAIPIYTNPTGFSNVPPPGPAIPVILNPQVVPVNNFHLRHSNLDRRSLCVGGK